MAKKINPRRRPATQADIQKAKKQATDEGVVGAFAIFFTALTDKEGWTKEQVKKLWDEIAYITDSVARKYVTVPQLVRTLREEYEIELQ